MSETQDKLSWSAFRYVANELDATEASEFESLLLTDQAAREAVANAVAETTRIRQALAGAVVVTAASERASWTRKSTRVAVVAVGSCLTLFLALCLVRSSRPFSEGVAHQAATVESRDSRAELAYAWAEARSGSVALRPVTHIAHTDTLDSLLNASLDLENEQSLVAPSWMLAALAKMDGGIDSEFESQE